MLHDQPTVRTEQLSVFYGDKRAVENVSLPFYKGAVTALIGPSGCGKSTYLRALNRMNDLIPQARVTGEVWYEGINLLQPRVDVVELRKRIGMVFQAPNPFPKSIYDNVAYGPRQHGMKKKSVLDDLVESSLRKAALWDEVKGRLYQSALDLSGGQQQRLCIARTLAMNPQVLLLDEPASALDPLSTAKIEALIDELRDSYCIVIVTHNMQQASRVSDYTAFFMHGRVVEYDQTEKLFTRPAQKQTEDYISGRFG
ncbi:phosphate ABC transporter ATP-binding protein PstB [Numidum massiliense]|uniref:phosphate ABC transporter ATP-binding protein PstB n=1 Tax=Numidum massiliense TaxID=1522315 RepID=UPI001E32BE79|nr:phosphate ABC transporter ATP-binding protein PstB [Numidum massiliense]